MVSGDSEQIVRSVKKVLRIELEQLFAKTSHDFGVKHNTCLGYSDPDTVWRDTPEETTPVIQDGFDTWREESLKRITSAFRELCAVVPPEKAEEHVWEVVNEVFQWTTDETSSLKFKKWYDVVTGVPIDSSIPKTCSYRLHSPEYNEPDADLADQLSLDFRTYFKNELALLVAKSSPALR